MLDTYRRNDKETHAGRKTSLTNIYLLFIARVRKGLLKVCVWKGTGDRTELKYFDLHSYDRQRCVVLVLWCSTGGPGVHSAGCWLYLLHLISIFSGPQLIWASRPLSAWCGFPYHISYITPTVCNSTGTWLPSWLRYIIIQRPHDRPLDLWNRMFNRHQGEITVMQFTGHSLPVHQSMSVP